MFKWKLFLATLALSTTGFSLLFFFGQPKGPRPVLPKLVPLTNDVYITSQLETRNVPALARRLAVDMIVDIRPDGEALDQIPSAAIEAAAKEKHMRFYYIPVPHEGIPESAVTALSKPEPGLTAWECLARFVVVVFALIVGFIAALIIALSAGWINIGC